MVAALFERVGEGVEWPWERWTTPFYKLLALQAFWLDPTITRQDSP